MPIDIRQEADDIFMLSWRGKITVEEVYDSHRETTALTQQAGIDRYIHIIDMADVESFPPSTAAALKILRDHPNVCGVFMINVPPSAKVLVNVLGQILPKLTLKVVCSLEEARTEAIRLLERTTT